MLKRLMLCLCWALSAGPVHAALELYLPMEGRPGSVRSVNDAAVRGINGTVRAHEGGGPAYVGDVPAPLRQRSQTSLRTGDKALVYFKDGKQLKTAGDFSVSCWIKLLDGADKNQTLLQRTGSWSLSYAKAPHALEFAVRNGGKLEFELPASFRQGWHHLVLIRHDHRYRLYLDGQPVGEARELADPLTDGGQLYLGAGSTVGGSSLAAQLDELGIWSRALNEKNVADLFQGVGVPDIVDETKLARIATAEFPAEIPVKPLPTKLEPVKNGAPVAVIAVQKGNLHAELAAVVQRKLAAAWGVTFPIREVADHADGREHLILFGANNSNMLLRELAANRWVSEYTHGSELRVIPQVLDWNRGVIYFGGGSASQVEAAVDRFLARFPAPASLPIMADLEKAPAYRPAGEYYDEIIRIFADQDRDKPARVTNGPLLQLLAAYRDTCDDRYAGVMGQAVSLMLEKYDAGKLSNRNRPQTFTFYQIPQFLFLIENSPAFNAKHRRDAAELMRRFVEDAMDYWELATPAKMYAQGQTGYLTNHYNFAARSAYHASRYLLDRHDYRPARYWQAVADHVFAGVQDHPISPEDAAGYHFLVYRIFTNHALASGKYDIDFFRNERYREAVDFAKMITNHLGYTPGYGDAAAIGNSSHYPLLRDALDILGDRESEYLLTLIAKRSGGSFYQETIDAMGLSPELPPPANPKYLGMNAIKLNKFLLEQNRSYPDFKRPVLNKAIFRSGWDDQAGFLAINGLTGAPHGHDDAAGICQYIKGDHVWLFEGHYINRHAEDHNVLNVIRDGEVPDRRRYFKTNLNMAAQIVAEAQQSDRGFALLSLLLENYNGIDQYRRIAWEKDGGFWVVDAAVARQPGDYTLINQFRSTGRVEETPQGVLITQERSDHPAVPHRLAISEGGGSGKTRFARLETCSGRANTVLPGYRYSDRITKSLLQRQGRKMVPGDTVYFFNYLSPLAGDAAGTEVRKLADNAFLAIDGMFPRLAVIGQLELPELTIDADACFIGPRGLLAENAKAIVIGGRRIAVKSGPTMVIDFGSELDREAVKRTLSGLAASAAQAVPNQPLPAVDAPEKQFASTLSFDHPVSALALDDRAVAVGLTDGTFKLLDFNGKTIAERKFNQRICAIAHIAAGAKSRWMIGVSGPKIDSTKEVSDGELYALDDAGNELWRRTIPFYWGRYGNVTTIFPAYLDGPDAAPAIIAGAESWTYFAFDPDGRQRWLARCTHGASGGAAGDLTGDGKDEIFIGNESYPHAIVDAEGKELKKTTFSPHDVDAKIIDLNGDGKLEIVVGRYDGYLYVDGLGDNPLIGRQLNIGGQPKNIVPLNDQRHRLAVAAFTGVVTFVGSDLKRTGHMVLPAPVTAMAARGDRVYAVAMDGYVYELEPVGIKAKFPFRYHPDAAEPPRAAGNGRRLAVSSDRNLYLLP
jgi:hypothetical protein